MKNIFYNEEKKKKKDIPEKGKLEEIKMVLWYIKKKDCNGGAGALDKMETKVLGEMTYNLQWELRNLKKKKM